MSAKDDFKEGIEGIIGYFKSAAKDVKNRCMSNKRIRKIEWWWIKRNAWKKPKK